MRFIVLMATLLFLPSISHAAPEQNVSVNIDGQVYHCSSNGTPGVNCGSKAASFKKVLETCNLSYSGGDCVRTHWPRYKQANPTCIDEGLPICLEMCIKSYSGGDCANRFCS